MITDPEELIHAEAEELWGNYMEAMDAVIICIKADNRYEALFYMAVVKVSIDLYFDRIEDIVDELAD